MTKYDKLPCQLELFSDGARAVAAGQRSKPGGPTDFELRAKLDAARTRPTTIQGLAAVLAYWAEFNEDIWDGTDLEDDERWETLAAAAEALA
jgi:hypothetical protein